MKLGRGLLLLTVVIVEVVVLSVTFVLQRNLASAAQASGMWSAWRSSATVETTPRPTSNPGLTSWWYLVLRQYCDSLQDPAKTECRSFLDRQIVPKSFLSLFSQLKKSAESKDSYVLSDFVVSETRAGKHLCVAGIAAGALDFAFIGKADVWPCVSTTTAGDPRSGILEHASKLTALQKALVGFELDKEMPLGAPVIERIYLLNNEGDIVSFRNGKKRQELVSFGHSALTTMAPSITSLQGFFDPDIGNYTGVYIDATDLGVVATLLQPIGSGDTVIAIDIRFVMDWLSTAQLPILPAPKYRSIVATTDQAETVVQDDGATSWNALAQRGLVPPLANAIARLRDKHKGSRRSPCAVDRKFSHVSSCDLESNDFASDLEIDALLAVQISSSRWLVVGVPSVSTIQAALPYAVVVVLGVLIALIVLAWHSDGETAQKLEQESAEKVNMLAALKVPMVVVGQNEVIRWSNEHAKALGAVTERNFVDSMLPPEDRRNKDYYARSQRGVQGTSMRSYAIRLRPESNGAHDMRYALIRSIELTADIRSFNAVKGDRLGLMMLPSDEEQRYLVSDYILLERRRLGSLVGHGLRALAGALNVRVSASSASDDIVRWLADYVDRRCFFVSMASGNEAVQQDASAEMIGAQSVLSTIERYNDVFRIIGQPEAGALRTDLRLNDGALSPVRLSEETAERRFIKAVVNWPENELVRCPVAHSIGFFIGEALVNAVRYSPPGSEVEFFAEPSNSNAGAEMLFRVVNPVDKVQGDVSRQRLKEPDRQFTGLLLLRDLARSFGWSPPELNIESDRATLTWRVPTIRLSSDGPA